MASEPFYCICGTLLSTDAPPGSCVLCGACGQVLVVPQPNIAANVPTPTGPAGQDQLGLPEDSCGEIPQATRSTAPGFGSRRALLAEAQVVPDANRCVQCGICSHNCPMNIDVRAHAWRGLPIHDSHCLVCSECVKRCPRGVLQFERLAALSFET